MNIASKEKGQQKELDADKVQKLFIEAIRKGNNGLIKKRLRQGASPSLATKETGETPLMAAALAGNFKLIEKLLPTSDISAVDKWGRVALLHSIWASAATRASPKFIGCFKSLLSPEIAKMVDNERVPPLMDAAGGHDKAFEEILAALAPLSDWKALDRHGNNLFGHALACAANENALAIWRASPCKGWMASSVNIDGRGIAHLAAMFDVEDALKEIAEYVDFGARDHMGRTPLMAAMAHLPLRSKTLRQLAAWSNCNDVDEDGCNALMLMIEGCDKEDDEEALKVASEIMGFTRLDAIDKLGESALVKALDRGLVETASVIQKGMNEEERQRLDESAEGSVISAASSSPRRL